MGDVEYWFFKCKVCSHFHKADTVNREGPFASPLMGLNVPFDGAHECQNQPGQMAQYQTKDWRTMTEAQWRELEEKVT